MLILMTYFKFEMPRSPFVIDTEGLMYFSFKRVYTKRNPKKLIQYIGNAIDKIINHYLEEIFPPTSLRNVFQTKERKISS